MASPATVYLYLRQDPTEVVRLGGIGPYLTGPNAVVQVHLTDDSAEAGRWAAALAAGQTP